MRINSFEDGGYDGNYSTTKPMTKRIEEDGA